MKKLFLITTVLSSLLFSHTIFADDLTLGGFDPTGNSNTPAISDSLAANAALRNDVELLHYSNDPVGGNPNGTITLVEFFDYRCVHCIRMYSSVETMLAQHGNLRIVYKIFPILGPESELAAHAALAANMQGKFIPFHRALMHSLGDFTLSSLTAIAADTGLDVDKFKHDMNSDKVAATIIYNMDLATRMGVNGTPSIFFAKTDLSAHSPPSNVSYIEGEASLSDLQHYYAKIH